MNGVIMSKRVKITLAVGLFILGVIGMFPPVEVRFGAIGAPGLDNSMPPWGWRGYFFQRTTSLNSRAHIDGSKADIVYNGMVYVSGFQLLTEASIVVCLLGLAVVIF